MIAGRKIEVRYDRGIETLKGKQKSVYVSQLPTECTEAEIRELFGSVGAIESVELNKSSKNGAVWSILHYESTDAAISAVEKLHHTMFDSSELVVRLDRKVAKR
jgi:RNA recognition motif-containing protein